MMLLHTISERVLLYSVFPLEENDCIGVESILPCDTNTLVLHCHVNKIDIKRFDQVESLDFSTINSYIYSLLTSLKVLIFNDNN